MPKFIRPSKLSAAIALWSMLQGPWLIRPEPFFQSSYEQGFYWLMAGLPLVAIFTAWRKRSTLILQTVFPLSLLPFSLLVPESIQAQSLTLWTMIPIIILWLFVLFPDKRPIRHEKTSVEPSKTFWFWFTGAMGILLVGTSLESDIEPVLLGLWTIGFSILWICFWALIVRYKTT